MIDFKHEEIQLKNMLSRFDRDIAILDVGCGTGRNLELLRLMGFENVKGLDINPNLVSLCKNKGFSAEVASDADMSPSQYDLILMSHIVEHFDHVNLVKFMNDYLKVLKNNGHILILTPLPHANFYQDFDHVKPYLPIGFRMVFSNEIEQVSFQVNNALHLEDIQFTKDQFRLRFYRGLYIRGANSLPLWINRVLKLIFFLSRGLVGYRCSWIGLYKLNKND